MPRFGTGRMSYLNYYLVLQISGGMYGLCCVFQIDLCLLCNDPS